MRPYLEMGLDRESQFKTRSLDLIRYHVFLWQREVSAQRQTHAEGGLWEDTGWGQHLQAEECLRPPEAGERQGPSVPQCPQKEPPSQCPFSSSLQNHGTIHFCCFKPLRMVLCYSSLRKRIQPDTKESAERNGAEMQGELKVYLLRG